MLIQNQHGIIYEKMDLVYQGKIMMDPLSLIDFAAIASAKAAVITVNQKQ
jgi:hypothetical protein